MKNLLFILLLLIPTKAQAQQVLPQDKLLYLGGCYVIGASITSITYYYTEDKKTAILAGAASVLVIGTVKELHDINHGNSDTEDLIADVIGGTLGILTVRINF